MRRTMTALIAGGLLAGTAACGSLGGATPVSTLTGGPEPAAKVSCEAVGDAYTKNIGPFAEALTKMVADRRTVKVAQQKLDAFGAAIRTATADSADLEIRADGKQTADRLHAKSADAKWFGTIRTAEDVNTALGPTLKEWLAPVTNHCS